jgi:hypothetical protein
VEVKSMAGQRTVERERGVAATVTADHLPGALRRYVERAILTDRPLPDAVRVTQAGDMWRTPHGRPMHFTATEEFAVREVAFSWNARFPIAPLLAMRIHDGFADGLGWMRGRFAGIPFMSKGGSDLALGAALRYLAEIPWVPHAILANQQIAWREVDARSVEASTQVGSTLAAVTVAFDAAGDISRIFTDARARDGDGDRPWGGSFGNYRVLGGVRVPTDGEVRWELPDGPFTYWKGSVTGVEIIDRGEGS